MRRQIESLGFFIFFPLKFLNYLNKTWKIHNPVYFSVLISLQDILKTISLAVNEETNGISWERLGGAAKRWISERLSCKESSILFANLAYISQSPLYGRVTKKYDIYQNNNKQKPGYFGKIETVGTKKFFLWSNFFLFLD